LFGIAAFCLGCLRFRIPPGAAPLVGRAFLPSEKLSRWLFSVSLVFGLFGVFAFLYVTHSSGGFMKVYSVAKGGGRAVSGYLGDGQHLTLPAIVLLILSTQGRRWKLGRIALLLLFAAPYLVIGFLGTRRGPAFGVLFCLLVPWYLASGRRPSLRSFVAALAFVGIIVLLLFSQRKLIRLGGDLDLDPGRLRHVLVPSGEGLLTGETYVFASGLVLTSKAYAHHYWGHRYAVIFLVRPIPRQLWPTKYQDSGMGWMLEDDKPGGMPIRYWREAVGWGPESGAASGFIADLYLEFAWIALLGCYLMGLLFSLLWHRALLAKGVWTLLYAEACILSIYVPTQSVSAFFHRFLLIAVPMAIIWRVRTSARGAMAGGYDGDSPAVTGKENV
jgi:oligosaccharide repeat unit polymerase